MGNLKEHMDIQVLKSPEIEQIEAALQQTKRIKHETFCIQVELHHKIIHLTKLQPDFISIIGNKSIIDLADPSKSF